MEDDYKEIETNIETRFHTFNFVDERPKLIRLNKHCLDS